MGTDTWEYGQEERSHSIQDLEATPDHLQEAVAHSKTGAFLEASGQFQREAERD